LTEAVHRVKARREVNVGRGRRRWGDVRHRMKHIKKRRGSADHHSEPDLARGGE